MTFADKINAFNRNLGLDAEIPEGIEVMNPFTDPEVMRITEAFYEKYYSDNRKRKILLGINPGRFGAGVTGIPFTDPVKLEKICGISNPFKKSREASADFIYDMITAFGGPEKFYDQYFIHAVCPLGFTKNGLNYNYYDDKELENHVTPFIVESLETMLSYGIDTSVCFCIGNGKNFKYLDGLNRKQHFFKKVVPLPHPRWIVQYRRKSYDEFIKRYIDHLS